MVLIVIIWSELFNDTLNSMVAQQLLIYFSFPYNTTPYNQDYLSDNFKVHMNKFNVNNDRDDRK